MRDEGGGVRWGCGRGGGVKIFFSRDGGGGRKDEIESPPPFERDELDLLPPSRS